MYEMDRHSFAVGCLFLAILLALMYCVATPARSQAVNQHPCGPTANIVAMLGKDYGERTTAGGIADDDSPVILFTNPITGSFTITVRQGDALCLLISGKGFALADPAPLKGDGL